MVRILRQSWSQERAACVHERQHCSWGTISSGHPTAHEMSSTSVFQSINESGEDGSSARLQVLFIDGFKEYLTGLRSWSAAWLSLIWFAIWSSISKFSPGFK